MHILKNVELSELVILFLRLSIIQINPIIIEFIFYQYHTVTYWNCSFIVFHHIVNILQTLIVGIVPYRYIRIIFEKYEISNFEIFLFSKQIRKKKRNSFTIISFFFKLFESRTVGIVNSEPFYTWYRTVRYYTFFVCNWYNVPVNYYDDTY